MRHLPILSEPHGEQRLKYSRQLELYKLGCRVSGGAQPQVMAPVLLAEYGVEERKGGKGGRGGAHPVRLSELPMKFLPNHLFAPAPIKCIVDGGEVMKGTWAIEQGSRRTSVTMKVDAHDHIYSSIFTVTKDCRRRLQTIVAGARIRGEVTEDLVRRFQTKVAGAWLRGEVAGQGYIISHHTQLRATMEKAFRTYGCGNTAPIRSPFGYLKPPEPAASDNRLIFSRDERSTLCTEHTNRKRGNSFLADCEKSGEANHRPTQANAKRGPHLPLCFEEGTTRLDYVELKHAHDRPLREAIWRIRQGLSSAATPAQRYEALAPRFHSTWTHDTPLEKRVEDMIPASNTSISTSPQSPSTGVK